MFLNTIDSKQQYVDKNGFEMIDIFNSIFSSKVNKGVIYAMYRATSEMEMRADLISLAAYGSDEYTEMLLKYSNIDNPFSLEKDDILVVPSLNTVYNDVSDVILATKNGESSKLIKNYHKYIDNSKVPSTIGSEKNNVEVSKSPSDTEANISKTGSSGITVIDGRIYFGNVISSNPNNVTDITGSNAVDSSIVDCAKNGVTLGQFLNATLKNENAKK